VRKWNTNVENKTQRTQGNRQDAGKRVKAHAVISLIHKVRTREGWHRQPRRHIATDFCRQANECMAAPKKCNATKPNSMLCHLNGFNYTVNARLLLLSF
jgi:hypothetical protein